MKSSEKPSRISITQLGWKALWLAMLLMHVPPILAVCKSLSAELSGTGLALGDMVRLVGLLGSAAFFILKIADVPWLRSIPTWRSRVAAIVIVALLHAGALERSGVVDATSASAKLSFVVLVAASLNAESVRTVLSRFARILTRACHRQSIKDLRVRLNRAHENLFLPYESLFSHRPTSPRAPPAC